MPSDFRLTVIDTGLDAYLEQLGGMEGRVANLRPILEGEYHDLHNKQTELAFFSSGATTARGSWPPLKVQKRQGPGQILVKTGDLRNSYTDRFHGQHVFEVSPRGQVKAGSRHKLARIHEVGTLHIPRRSLEKSSRDVGELNKVLERYVVTGKGRTL